MGNTSFLDPQPCGRINGRHPQFTLAICPKYLVYSYGPNVVNHYSITNNPKKMVEHPNRYMLVVYLSSLFLCHDYDVVRK